MIVERRLGKLPARKGAIKFKLGTFFAARNLPTPPAVFGHYGSVEKFYGLGNDKWGCCVFAGAAHETMIWSVAGGRPRARFTIKDVLSDYSAVTGFDPAKPETDAGTDMQIAASYRRKTGIIDATGKRHTIDAYVAPRVGDADELALAVYLTGAAGVGLMLPNSAMDQSDRSEPWSVVQRDGGIAGGHYVAAVGRRANGNFVVVTWGKLQEMTPEFYARYSDEGIAYVSLELIRDKVSPEGFDADQLRAALANLSAAGGPTNEKRAMPLDAEPAAPQIDPGEIDAAFLAVREHVDAMTYMGFNVGSRITDEQCRELASAVVAKIEGYRHAESI